MHHGHDHRALRRATDPSALAAWWLGLAVGLAAIVGAALDACGATAQAGGVRDPLLVFSVYGADQGVIAGIIRVSGDSPLRNVESVSGRAGSGPSSYAELRIATWKVLGVKDGGGEGSTPVIPPSSTTRDPVVGVLSWGDGAGPRRVEITERDLLWLARALVGSQTAAAREAGASPSGFAVGAWCRLRAAANRHAAMAEVDARAGRPPRFSRIGDSLREYSTATSSRWAPGGPACGPSGTHATSPMCGPARLARRAAIRSLSWGSIAATFGDLRGAVRAWARGEHEDDARAALLPADHAIVVRATHTDQIARRVRLPSAVCGSNRYWAGRPAAPEIRLHPP